MNAKKILAFLISAVMAVQCVPMQAMAEDKGSVDAHITELLPAVVETDTVQTEETIIETKLQPTEVLPVLYASEITSRDFTYTINEDGTTATITGFVGEETGDLVISDEIDGYSVTKIGNSAFYGCSGFTGSLTIPDSVTSIGSYAFRDCSGFTGSLTIRDSVTTIGDNAFSGCSGFTGSLTIPNSVTTIGDNAFSDCSGFTGSLTIPDSITTINSGVFDGCSGFTGDLIIPDSVTSIGFAAFQSCIGFTGSLKIGNNVTSIDSWAFNNCSGFTGNLIIGNSVSSIGGYAFRYCSGFTGRLTIPDSVTTIGGYAFHNCSSFTGNLAIPESVASLGYGVFLECNGIANAYFYGNVPKTWGLRVFEDNAENFTIHYIADNDSGWTSPIWTAPDGTVYNTDTFTLETGEYRGFSYVVNRDGVTVTITGYIAEASGDLVIPGKFDEYSVTAIGNGAFENCSGFTGSLTIPDSVTSIGESAFKGCSGLTGSLTIPNSVTSIGDFAFFDCSRFTGSLTIPDSVVSVGKYAFHNCSGLTGQLTVSSGMTSIGYSVFSSCKGISSISIPSTVKSIGEYAFFDCTGIEGKVTIPNSVTFIGSYAFSSCSGISEIILPDSVTTIEAGTFLECTALTEIVIPDKLTSIGSTAFYYCQNLKEITLPDTLTSVGQLAFYSCSELKKAYFASDVPDSWGGRVFENTNAAFVILYNDTVESNWNTPSWTAPDGAVYKAYPASEYVAQFTYSVNDDGNTVTITGYSGNGENLSIPSGIDGYTVTHIGNYAFFDDKTIYGEISIPMSVVSVGTYAFYWCTNVISVKFEGNVPTNWGRNAFKDIGENFVIYWPSGNSSGWTTPTWTAPDGNVYNTETFIPETEEQVVFEYIVNEDGVTATITGYIGEASGDLVIPDTIEGYTVTAIGNSAFYNDSGFTGSLTIPNSVTSIGKYAFYNCSGLTGNLTIPDSVTSIGEYAFFFCSGFSGELTIGNNVTSIGRYAFRCCSGFTGLTLGSNIEVIGDSAFDSCSGFKGDLIIPDNVTSIGEYAFYSCSSFSGKLTIPDSVTSIGRYAFYSCSGFTGLTLGSNIEIIEDWTFKSCSGFKGDLIIPDNVTSIGEYAFCSCSGFTGSLIIPDSVISIGDFAFSACSGFTGLTLGSDIEVIGYCAFESCNGFKGDLIIPDNVTSIGAYAFYSCDGFSGDLIIGNGVTALEQYVFGNCSSFKGSLIIGDSVATIDEFALYNCKGFTGNLYIGNSITEIPSFAFQDWNFKGTLTIGNNITSIGSYAFDGCEGFTGSLILPEGLTCIEDCVFQGCSGFSGSLIIPDSVTVIGRGAFDECTGFNGTLTLSDNVTSIGNMAFDECSGFKGSLTIPESVTNIGSYAFYNCSGFDGTLTIPDGVISIGDWAFAYCSGFTGSLTIPDTVTSIGERAFMLCKGFKGQLKLSSNITALKEGTFSSCTGFTGDLNIPDTIVSIGNNVFYHCENLSRKLVIPNSVVSIGEYAFSGCENLTGALIIPDSVTDIGVGAFSGLTNMTGELIISDSISRIEKSTFSGSGFTGTLTIPKGVTSIGDNAFSGCDGFSGNLIIPSGISSIGNYAFFECDGFEDKLTIPKGVISVGDNAFYCCRNISEVYFKGDVPSIFGESVFVSYVENIPEIIFFTPVIYYTDNNLSGWTSPTWTAPDGAVYNTATFIPDDDNTNDETAQITTTWDTYALTLSEGDTYAFSGQVISTVPLDKLHISVVRADNTSVGIDYYRAIDIGSTTFDLSAVPSVTAGTLLEGLQVTNNQSELSLSNGSYLIRMWITDTDGNYLDGLSKMITVTDVSAAPVVKMLPVTEITASTAKLQAKIVDAKGGIIVDFGFNMYDTETGGERHAQYRAKQTDPEYQTDPYYQTAEYDPETGIFTVVLQDHNPNRTYYAEGFAVYYQGETPVTGFTPERTGFTTAVAQVNITSPEAYQVLSSADVSVTGNIDCRVDGVTFDNPILTVYDYQMTEVTSVNGILSDDNTFSAEIDLTDRYAGTYSITVSADASNGSSVVSAPVSFNIPGKIAVYTDPVDESNITATKATVTGRLPDTMGETLEYYGFRCYDEAGEYLGMYFVGHDDETRWTTSFDPSTGVITGDIPAEPDTTIYYEAFASYITAGVQIDSIAATRESFTTKSVDITLDKINSYDGLSYMLDETAPHIKFHGHISNVADGHTFGNPQLVVTDSKGELIESAEVELKGNEFTAEFDMSAYEVGVYTITAQITDDTGRVSYSNIKKVEMPKKCSEIVFKTNLGGEVLAQDEVHTIAHYNWLVVDIELDTSRDDIKKIEWSSSDDAGLKLVPWNKSDKYYDKERPQTCQFNAKEIGTYTVTVSVYNHDGTVTTASLQVAVWAVATLCFVDYLTMQPLADIKVTVKNTNGKAYSISANTNEYGQVILTDIPQYASYTVEAQKSGYTTLLKQYALGDGSNQMVVMYDDAHYVYDVTMTAFYTQNGETVTTHSGTDILNTAATIDLAKKYTVSLKVTANESLQVTNYQLLQNKTVIEADTDGTFVLYNLDNFIKNAPIYLRLCYGTNQYYDVVLQLKFRKSLLNEISDGISNTEFSIGDEIKIEIPTDVPIVGGHEFSLDLSNLPATVKKTGRQYFIAIGGNNLIDSDKDDNVIVNDEKLGLDDDFIAFCDLVADAKKNGIKEAINLAKDYSWEIESTKKPFYSGMDVEFTVLGTFMFNAETAEGNMTLVIEAKVKNSKDYTAPPLGPVPMVITLSFEGSVGAKFYGNETGHSIDEILVSLLENVVVETGVKIQAGYGAGLSYVGHVTINGGIGFDADIYLSSLGKVDMELGFDLSLRAKLLAWEYQKSLAGVTYRLNSDGWAYKWKNQSNWTPLSGSMTTYSLRTLNDFSNIPTTEYTLSDRSYLSRTTDWYEGDENHAITTFASFGSNDYTTDVDTLMTYIYPDTQLQTVQTDDCKVMIWLTDDATRGDANFTKLVYSVFSEATGKWSTPQCVADDGTLDSYPVLTTDGTSIYAAWVTMNMPLTDDMSLDDAMLCSEIRTAVFDPQTMSFRSVTNLTANNVIDLQPSIAVNGDQVIAAWVSNDSGDLWGTTGSNTIYISRYADGTWSDAEAVTTLNNAITSSNIGFVDGKSCIAYTVDTDNSLDTSDDINLCLFDLKNSSEILLEEGGLNCNIQFITMQDKQLLTWYADGYVMYIDTADAVPADLLNGTVVTGNYQLISDINGTVMLKATAMDGYSELYVSVYDESDASWSNDIRMTYQNSAYINDFEALIEENGDITVIYTSELEDMAQMCSGTVSFVKDISLDSVSHNPYDALPGQMTVLYADVTNHGIADVESVLFRLQKDDTILCETEAELHLGAGETISVEVPVTVPEADDITEYEVEIVLPDAEEIELTNNTCTVDFGHGSLSLYVSDMYGENSRLLTFEVINNSGYPTSPFITVYKDTEEKTVLETIKLDELAGKSCAIVSYVLMDMEDSVYIELTSNREEYYTGDNLVYYSLVSETILWGDINDDGTVDNADSMLLQQYFAGYSADFNESAADVDNDGSLTRRDAMILARHVTGWKGYETLPYTD